jgi:16S rRNA (uracil1498-N3)-methyltransferase
VAEIVPVLTGRAIATAEGREKVERWRRIAEEACKQCGRSLVPTVHAPLDVPAFLAHAADASLKIVPWEGGGEPLATVVGRSGRAARAAALVGPEGGLTASEVAAAELAGFAPVTLGPRVLRTETAGIVTVAALQLLAGDLR